MPKLISLSPRVLSISLAYIFVLLLIHSNLMQKQTYGFICNISVLQLLQPIHFSIHKFPELVPCAYLIVGSMSNTGTGLAFQSNILKHLLMYMSVFISV